MKHLLQIFTVTMAVVIGSTFSAQAKDQPDNNAPVTNKGMPSEILEKFPELSHYINKLKLSDCCEAWELYGHFDINMMGVYEACGFEESTVSPFALFWSRAYCSNRQQD